MAEHDPLECTQVDNIQHLTDAITGDNGIVVKVSIMMEQLKTIKDDTTKIRYTLYGNGEPGICENVRQCMSWIRRINWVGGIFMVGAIGTFWYVIQRFIVRS